MNSPGAVLAVRLGDHRSAAGLERPAWSTRRGLPLDAEAAEAELLAHVHHASLRLREPQFDRGEHLGDFLAQPQSVLITAVHQHGEIPSNGRDTKPKTDTF